MVRVKRWLGCGWLNTIGLVLGIAGVVIIFFWGPPPNLDPQSYLRRCHVWTPLADQGLFLALRGSWVRSCLRPFARTIGSAGPDVVR